MNKYAKIDYAKSLAKKYSNVDLEVIEIYENIIKELDIFCKSLDASNVSEVFNIFSILSHNGYLSYNKLITLGPTKSFDIFNYEGSSILVGTGNCLNFSNFLKRLYIYMGYESFVIANYLYNVKDSNFDTINRIVQRILKFNHACCFVFENNIPYIFDPLNVEAYLYKNDKYQVGNHGSKLRVNFDKTYLLNTMSLDQLSDLRSSSKIYLSMDKNEKSNIDNNLGKIKKPLFDILNNTDCMEEFHEKIKPDLKRVKKLQKYY